MVSEEDMLLEFMVDYGIPLMLLLYLGFIVVFRLRKGSKPKHILLEGLAIMVSYILFGVLGGVICILAMRQYPVFPIKPKSNTPQ